MYNWSVDEKKFKNLKQVVDFLKKQPEISSVAISRYKRRKQKSLIQHPEIVVRVKMEPNTHPVRKVLLAKTLQEKCSNMRISIVEEPKN